MNQNCESLHTQTIINQSRKTELFPLVDETGKVVGKATRQACHSGSKLLHPVVHLHIFNKRGLPLPAKTVDE